MGIFARKDIPAGSEIFYDYMYEHEGESLGLVAQLGSGDACEVWNSATSASESVFLVCMQERLGGRRSLQMPARSSTVHALYAHCDMSCQWFDMQSSGGLICDTVI